MAKLGPNKAMPRFNACILRPIPIRPEKVIEPDERDCTVYPALAMKRAAWFNRPSGLGDDPRRDRLVRMAEEVAEAPRTICLRAVRPAEKCWIFVGAVDRESGALPLYATYTFSYENDRFTEDFCQRNRLL